MNGVFHRIDQGSTYTSQLYKRVLNLISCQPDTFAALNQPYA